MIVWTVLALDITCGFCGELIRSREPVARFTVTRRYRCARHAGEPIDWTAITHALEELDRPSEPAPTALSTRSRVSVPRAPLPLSAIAGSIFDHKAAASGDRND